MSRCFKIIKRIALWGLVGVIPAISGLALNTAFMAKLRSGDELDYFLTRAPFFAGMGFLGGGIVGLLSIACSKKESS